MERERRNLVHEVEPQQTTKNYVANLNEYKFFSSNYLRQRLKQRINLGYQTLEPDSQKVFGCLLFADISGFTQLSSRLNAEELKKHINEYFTLLLNIIHSNHGDVIKFCGDAVLIMWPVPVGASEDLKAAAVLMASLCALQLMEECGEYRRGETSAVATSKHSFHSTASPSNSIVSRHSSASSSTRHSHVKSASSGTAKVVELSLHCGIACGLLSTMILGDGNRFEFILAGEVLKEMGEAESAAKVGEVGIFHSAYDLIRNKLEASPFGAEKIVNTAAVLPAVHEAVVNSECSGNRSVDGAAEGTVKTQQEQTTPAPPTVYILTGKLVHSDLLDMCSPLASPRTTPPASFLENIHEHREVFQVNRSKSNDQSVGSEQTQLGQFNTDQTVERQLNRIKTARSRAMTEGSLSSCADRNSERTGRSEPDNSCRSSVRTTGSDNHSTNTFATAADGAANTSSAVQRQSLRNSSDLWTYFEHNFAAAAALSGGSVSNLLVAGGSEKSLYETQRKTLGTSDLNNRSDFDRRRRSSNGILYRMHSRNTAGETAATKILRKMPSYFNRRSVDFSSAVRVKTIETAADTKDISAAEKQQQNKPKKSILKTSSSSFLSFSLFNSSAWNNNTTDTNSNTNKSSVHSSRSGAVSHRNSLVSRTNTAVSAIDDAVNSVDQLVSEAISRSRSLGHRKVTSFFFPSKIVTGAEEYSDSDAEEEGGQAREDHQPVSPSSQSGHNSSSKTSTLTSSGKRGSGKRDGRVNSRGKIASLSSLSGAVSQVTRRMNRQLQSTFTSFAVSSVSLLSALSNENAATETEVDASLRNSAGSITVRNTNSFTNKASKKLSVKYLKHKLKFSSNVHVAAVREFIASWADSAPTSQLAHTEQLDQPVESSSSEDQEATGKLLSIATLQSKRAQLAVDLRKFVHETALSAIETHTSALLSEMREVTTLFIQIRGLDNDFISGSSLRPQRVFCIILSVLQRFGGSLRQLVVDDKGCVCIVCFGLFGSSNENNNAQAVDFALALRNALLSVGTSSAMGITTGKVYCGIVGAGHRCEFAVMGSSVNLAARLMCASAALPSSRGVLVDSVVHKGAENLFKFQEMSSIKAKGYAEPVCVFAPIRKRKIDKLRSESTLVATNKTETLGVKTASPSFRPFAGLSSALAVSGASEDSGGVSGSLLRSRSKTVRHTHTLHDAQWCVEQLKHQQLVGAGNSTALKVETNFYDREAQMKVVTDALFVHLFAADESTDTASTVAATEENTATSMCIELDGTVQSGVPSEQVFAPRSVVVHGESGIGLSSFMLKVKLAVLSAGRERNVSVEVIAVKALQCNQYMSYNVVGLLLQRVMGVTAESPTISTEDSASAFSNETDLTLRARRNSGGVLFAPHNASRSRSPMGSSLKAQPRRTSHHHANSTMLGGIIEQEEECGSGKRRPSNVMFDANRRASNATVRSDGTAEDFEVYSNLHYFEKGVFSWCETMLSATLTVGAAVKVCGRSADWPETEVTLSLRAVPVVWCLALLNPVLKTNFPCVEESLYEVLSKPDLHSAISDLVRSVLLQTLCLMALGESCGVLTAALSLESSSVRVLLIDDIQFCDVESLSLYAAVVSHLHTHSVSSRPGRGCLVATCNNSDGRAFASQTMKYSDVTGCSQRRNASPRSVVVNSRVAAVSELSLCVPLHKISIHSTYNVLMDRLGFRKWTWLVNNYKLAIGTAEELGGASINKGRRSPMGSSQTAVRRRSLLASPKAGAPPSPSHLMRNAFNTAQQPLVATDRRDSSQSARRSSSFNLVQSMIQQDMAASVPKFKIPPPITIPPLGNNHLQATVSAGNIGSNGNNNSSSNAGHHKSHQEEQVMELFYTLSQHGLPSLVCDMAASLCFAIDNNQFRGLHQLSVIKQRTQLVLEIVDRLGGVEVAVLKAASVVGCVFKIALVSAALVGIGLETCASYELIESTLSHLADSGLVRPHHPSDTTHPISGGATTTGDGRQAPRRSSVTSVGGSALSDKLASKCYTFSDESTQVAIYNIMLESQRSTAHTVIAAQLEESYHAEVAKDTEMNCFPQQQQLLNSITTHYMQGENSQKKMEFLLLSSAQASKENQFTDAIAFLSELVCLATALDEEELRLKYKAVEVSTIRYIREHYPIVSATDSQHKAEYRFGGLRRHDTSPLTSPDASPSQSPSTTARKSCTPLGKLLRTLLPSSPTKRDSLSDASNARLSLKLSPTRSSAKSPATSPSKDGQKGSPYRFPKLFNHKVASLDSDTEHSPTAANALSVTAADKAPTPKKRGFLSLREALRCDLDNTDSQEVIDIRGWRMKPLPHDANTQSESLMRTDECVRVQPPAVIEDDERSDDTFAQLHYESCQKQLPPMFDANTPCAAEDYSSDESGTSFVSLFKRRVLLSSLHCLTAKDYSKICPKNAAVIRSPVSVNGHAFDTDHSDETDGDNSVSSGCSVKINGAGSVLTAEENEGKVDRNVEILECMAQLGVALDDVAGWIADISNLYHRSGDTAQSKEYSALSVVLIEMHILNLQHSNVQNTSASSPKNKDLLAKTAHMTTEEMAAVTLPTDILTIYAAKGGADKPPRRTISSYFRSERTTGSVVTRTSAGDSQYFTAHRNSINTCDSVRTGGRKGTRRSVVSLDPFNRISLVSAASTDSAEDNEVQQIHDIEEGDFRARKISFSSRNNSKRHMSSFSFHFNRRRSSGGSEARSFANSRVKRDSVDIHRSAKLRRNNLMKSTASAARKGSVCAALHQQQFRSTTATSGSSSKARLSTGSNQTARESLSIGAHLGNTAKPKMSVWKRFKAAARSVKWAKVKPTCDTRQNEAEQSTVLSDLSPPALEKLLKCLRLKEQLAMECLLSGEAITALLLVEDALDCYAQLVQNGDVAVTTPRDTHVQAENGLLRIKTLRSVVHRALGKVAAVDSLCSLRADGRVQFLARKDAATGEMYHQCEALHCSAEGKLSAAMTHYSAAIDCCAKMKDLTSECAMWIQVGWLLALSGHVAQACEIASKVEVFLTSLEPASKIVHSPKSGAGCAECVDSDASPSDLSTALSNLQLMCSVVVQCGVGELSFPNAGRNVGTPSTAVPHSSDRVSCILNLFAFTSAATVASATVVTSIDHTALANLSRLCVYYLGTNPVQHPATNTDKLVRQQISSVLLSSNSAGRASPCHYTAHTTVYSNYLSGKGGSCGEWLFTGCERPHLGQQESPVVTTLTEGVLYFMALHCTLSALYSDVIHCDKDAVDNNSSSLVTSTNHTATIERVSVLRLLRTAYKENNHNVNTGDVADNSDGTGGSINPRLFCELLVLCAHNLEQFRALATCQFRGLYTLYLTLNVQFELLCACLGEEFGPLLHTIEHNIYALQSHVETQNIENDNVNDWSLQAAATDTAKPIATSMCSPLSRLWCGCGQDVEEAVDRGVVYQTPLPTDLRSIVRDKAAVLLQWAENECMQQDCGVSLSHCRAVVQNNDNNKSRGENVVVVPVSGAVEEKESRNAGGATSATSAGEPARSKGGGAEEVEFVFARSFFAQTVQQLRSVVDVLTSE